MPCPVGIKFVRVALQDRKEKIRTLLVRLAGWSGARAHTRGNAAEKVQNVYRRKSYDVTNFYHETGPRARVVSASHKFATGHCIC